MRGIVLDLRHNPGGENAAYASLLDTLVSVGRRERVVVLRLADDVLGAANFLADLEARVPVRIVGEPSGGSPNLDRGSVSAPLGETGWSVNVGTVWWQKSRAGADDPRLAFEPHVSRAGAVGGPRPRARPRARGGRRPGARVDSRARWRRCFRPSASCGA